MGRWIFLKNWLKKVQETVGEGEATAWRVVGTQRQEEDWFLARRPWVSISAAASRRTLLSSQRKPSRSVSQTFLEFLPGASGTPEEASLEGDCWRSHLPCLRSHRES